MTITTPSRSFDMGRVAQRTFDALTANLVTFGLISILLFGLPKVAAGWFQLPNGGPGGLDAFSRGMIYFVLSLVAEGARLIAMAAIIHGVVAHLRGQGVRLGESLAQGLRHWWPMALIRLLVSILSGFALLLLIVPGVILMVRWSVSLPVQVIENRSVSPCLSRSADLTRGRGWSIFGLCLVYLVIVALLQLAAISLSGGFREGIAGLNTIAANTVLIEPLTAMISGPISAAGLAAIYVELTGARQSAERLAEVFA